MDAALLTSAIISGIIALFIAFISNDEFDDRFFIGPLLTPLKYVQSSLASKGTPCIDCPSEHVDPYARITVRRMQLAANLGTIALGLIAQAIILLWYQNLTAAISFTLWALIPTFLVVRYVIGLKDVFNYWNNSAFRPALAVFAVCVGFISAQDPYLLDVVGWFMNPRTLFSIDGWSFVSGYVTIIVGVVFFAFIIARYFINRRVPSLKNRVLRAFKDFPKDMKTVKAWQKVVDPTAKYPRINEEAVEGVLRELVYQGKAKISLDKPTAQNRYGPI